MQNLLDFILKYYHWMLFLVLEVICGVLLFRYNSYQGSVWLSSANRVTGQVYEWQSAVTQFFSLTERNALLEERNVELEQQLNTLREQMAELKGDSTAATTDHLPAKESADYALISAKVIANAIDTRDNLMTINRGSADGVRKDMGVVSGHGIVGIVYLVSAHYAVVMPVLNSHSSISCSIKGSGYFGSLEWTGGDAEVAHVDGIPLHAKFAKGDSIVTSGYSSIFPAGLLAGTIKSKSHSDDGLSYRLSVQLATDFGSLRDVCVVDNTPMREQLDLLRQAAENKTTSYD